MSAYADAIQFYHDRLTPEVAQESQAQLDRQMRWRGLFFGERPLTTVLRPRFLTPADYRLIQRQTSTLLKAFDKIHQAALADEDFLDQFALAEWEKTVIRYPTGYHAASPISRLDAFFTPESRTLKFTEYNAETPAAPAYNDVLTDVFYTLPVMRDFLRRYEVRSLPARHGVLHALLDCYQQFLGRTEAPRIAILDWPHVPTYSEFVLFEDYFRSQGLECVIANPDEVEYRQGKLSFKGFHIDLVFKRILVSEMYESRGLDHPVLQAVRDGAVCMVNPPACKVTYKKASLAVLSDELNQHLFNKREQAAIAAHIPWTRFMRERKTTFGGQAVDLLPFVLENKDNLVLKPNDDFGGHGIVLGWTVGQPVWETAVHRALTEPYVVQERIMLPSEPYPSLVDGNLEIYDRMQDTNPFIFHGDSVYGCLTRLSTAALLNVTAGGGSTVPTFLVERR